MARLRTPQVTWIKPPELPEISCGGFTGKETWDTLSGCRYATRLPLCTRGDRRTSKRKTDRQTNRRTSLLHKSPLWWGL